MSLFDTPEKRIRAAAMLTELFKSGVYAEIEARMERATYEEFLMASSSDDRVRAWAKGVVIRELRHQMQVVIDSGEVNIMQIAAEEKKRQQKEK